MIEPATALAFSLYENKGVLCAAVGQRLSRASQIPTGGNHLRPCPKSWCFGEAGEQADWAAWYHTRFGKEPNYSDLLDMSSHTPDERRAILHHYIEPTTEDIEEGERFRPKPTALLLSWYAMVCCAGPSSPPTLTG